VNKIGLIAGSFDPITNGHTWLIKQALTLVDVLYVVIGNNPAKRYMFSELERTNLVKAVCEDAGVYDRIVVQSTSTEMLVNVAFNLNVDFLIRGIRNASDFEYESQMLLINRRIQPSINTVFLIPPRELTEVSSSTVKSLVGFTSWGGVVTNYVSPCVLAALQEKVK